MKGSDPWEKALRLLAVRDRSEAELRERLRQSGFPEERIAAVLARCREQGYLDDARFARSRALSLMQSGRAVGSRLLADLSRRGIPPEAAREAVEETAREVDPEELARELRRRRFPGFDYARAEERERRRAVNFFLRRGFSLELILSILKEER